MTTFPLETQKPQILGPAPSPVVPAGASLAVDQAGAARTAAANVPCAAIPLPNGFILPSEATDDAKEILAGNYDVPGLKEPPKTILDAGAHVGLFTYWAKKRWPEAAITAYEAHPENFAILDKNSRLLPLVRGVSSALSDHNSTMILRRGKNSLCHSANASMAMGEKLEVPCVDASTIGRFDFVKVDTEGSELPILSALDLSETKAVVCEAHSDGDRIAINELMRRKGFNLIGYGGNTVGLFTLKFARQSAIIEKRYAPLEATAK